MVILKRTSFVLLTWLASFFVLWAQGQSGTDPSFQVVLQKHLAAIQGRDLKVLEETITSGEKLTLIFGDGEKLDTRQQYLDFSKEWFADKGWRWQPEVLQVLETPMLAHVLLKYQYSSHDKNNQPRQSTSFLALTFAKEKDGWRLVFDQNTKIQPK